MALVTHGTTLAGFKAIMAGEGKALLGAAPWTVSDNDGNMYFYDVKSVGADYDCSMDDEGDREDAITHTANKSFEAARLQYAVQGKGGKVVVLVCNIPDCLLEADYSCGSSDVMSDARSIPCNEFDPAWIVDIRVADFDQWDCVAVLACVWDNGLFNQGEVPERLAKLVEAVAGNDGLYDSLYDFHIESVHVPTFIAQNA